MSASAHWVNLFLLIASGGMVFMPLRRGEPDGAARPTSHGVAAADRRSQTREASSGLPVRFVRLGARLRSSRASPTMFPRIADDGDVK
jgi:hypothetical protein